MTFRTGYVSLGLSSGLFLSLSFVMFMFVPGVLLGQTYITGDAVIVYSSGSAVYINGDTTLNRTAGSSDIDVRGEVHLSRGTVTYSSGDFNVLEGGSLIFSLSATASATDASHTSGLVRWIAEEDLASDNAFTFPIGTGTEVGELSVADALKGTEVRAEFIAGDGTVDRGTAMAGSLEALSTHEYWLMSIASGTYDGSVTLHFEDAASNVSDLVSDLSALRVAGWNTVTSSWDDLGGTATGTAISGTITSTSGQDLSSYDAFTLASASGSGSVKLSVKVMLQGALIDRGSGSGYLTQKMRTDLASGGHIPTLSPYGDTVSSSLDFVEREVVDWVQVELYDSDRTRLVSSQSALLRSDGVVMDVTGAEELLMTAAASDYYVAVKHRNHLGVMSEGLFGLSGSVTEVDFVTALSSDIYDAGDASIADKERFAVPGTSGYALWAGDTNGDGKVQYASVGNDVTPILNVVGADSTDVIKDGYLREDVDMNGEVQYAGSGNDVTPVLNIVGADSTDTVVHGVFED